MAGEMQQRREPLRQIQILNTVYRQWNCGGPPKIYCGSPIFRQSAAAPYKLDVASPPPIDLVYDVGEVQAKQKAYHLGCPNLDLQRGSANILRPRAQFVIVGWLANHTGKVTQWYI